MKNVKILFQGDSITDAGRDREDYHHLGYGYPLYAAENLKKMLPGTEFEFINLGISGHQTIDLVNRLQSDFVDIQPDVVSILVGVNDTWHHADSRNWIPNEVFEERYRSILETVKTKTNAKILMLEPFLIPVDDKQWWREDLDPKIQIVRMLAREYADAYIPVDGLLAAAFVGDEPTSFAEDGVHPSEKGSRFIGGLYAEAMATILENL